MHDIEQMELRGLARNTDPETSHTAGKSVDAGRLMQRIYKVMARFGDEGCISDDVGHALPDLGVQTYTPRFKQMIDKGMIELTGEKRKGDANRMQLVRRVLPPPFTPRIDTSMTSSEVITELKRRIYELEERYRHYFYPSSDNEDFCTRCGEYLTSNLHHKVDDTPDLQN
jgi:hypothetical protein